MELTALCSRLLFYVLVFLCAEDQHCYCDGNAASLRVDPNRLQFFEYDSVWMDCDGLDDSAEWSVMRRTAAGVQTCGSSWEALKTPCFIKDAYPADSGEYWCEAEGGGRSSSVSIAVTDGPVLLQSPAVPVTEGDSVTLSCRQKTPSSLPVADFFKDGRLMHTGYDGNITIHNVSKSDAGLYRCVIAGAGESAESRLAVRETQTSHGRALNLPLLCITVLLFLVNVPLLLVGLHLCKTYRVSDCVSSQTPALRSGDAAAASGSPRVVHPLRAECPAVTQNISYTAAGCEAAGSEPSFTDECAYYCTID